MVMMAVNTSKTTPIHFNLPPWLFWMAWTGFLALIVLMLYAKARQVRQRRAALEQFAMENGFQFSDKPDEGSTAQLAQIHVAGAQMGGAARFSNLLRGSAAGVETIIADRTIGSGKNQSTSTIVAFNHGKPLPDFMLCRENIFWRVVEKFGYSDIDFDGAPDFSRRFFLHGKDAAAVRTLFKPEVTQAFEQLDEKMIFCVSSSGPWLVFYRMGRLISPSELRDFLQQAELLVNAFRRAQSSGVFA